MEKLKSYGLAAALCGAALAPVAQGAYIFTLGVNKTHFFTGPYTVRFEGGDFSAQMNDGAYSIYFCQGQPFPAIVQPVPIVCPIGTTAYVVSGDEDGDGALDGADYRSYGQPQAASFVEPFEADRINLSASPTGLVLGGFRDSSTRIYYNLFDPTNFSEYDLAQYTISTTYAAGVAGSLSGVGQLIQMNKALPAGAYVFKFPARKTIATQNSNLSVYPQVVIGTFIEAFGLQRYGAGFRFTSGLWDGQYYQMDPRTLTKISWTGNSSNLVRPGIDSLRYAILTPGASGADEADYLYPVLGQKYYVNSNSSVLDTYLNLPPGSFKVGDLADLSVQFQRNGMNTNIDQGLAVGTYDVSLRDFRAKLKMVDSYAGWAASAFPQGTLASKTAATADYDKDGVNNGTEYAAEFPTLEQLAAASGVAITGYADTALPNAMDATKKDGLEVGAAFLDDDNHIRVQITKRANTGTTLTPAFTIGTPDSNGNVAKFTKLTVGTNKAYDFVYRMSADDPTVVDPVDPDLSTPTSVTKTVKTASGSQSITATVDKHFWTLRSKDPVADPTAPLPVFKATVTVKALK